MSRAFVVRENGGPEQLQLEELEVPAPGPGQIKVRNRAIGLNFIDVYQRTGLYATPLPFVAGNEGAGEVLSVGPGVTGFAPGDRVAYQGPVGAYAEARQPLAIGPFECARVRRQSRIDLTFGIAPEGTQDA